MLTSTTPRRTITVVTALSAVALSLALAGCSTTNDETGSNSTYSNMDDWGAAMNSCLREQGIEVGTGGGVMLGEGQSQEEVEAAFNTCNEKVGTPPGMENFDDPQKINESNQILVDCLQGKGYDIADIKEGESPMIPADLERDDLDECYAASLEVFN